MRTAPFLHPERATLDPSRTGSDTKIMVTTWNRVSWQCVLQLVATCGCTGSIFLSVDLDEFTLRYAEELELHGES